MCLHAGPLAAPALNLTLVFGGLSCDSQGHLRRKGKTDESGSYQTKQVSELLTRFNAYRTRQINMCESGKQENTYCPKETSHY